MPATRSISGFTLVELMVTVSIIAILASIGLTIFTQAQIAARDGRRVADMGETQKALEQFYAVHRSYISLTSAGINDAPFSSLTSGTTGNISHYFQNSVPPSDPNPAIAGADYRYYSCNAPATQYIICAALENCTGKCNMSKSAPPGDGCANLAAPGSVGGNGLYCVKSLSN